jgi:hypothetical protein
MLDYQKYIATPAAQEVRRKAAKKRNEARPTANRDYQQQHYYKNKKLVYDHYGRRCLCCGVTSEVFLAIDHVNNDGEVDRRQTGGAQLYRKIIKHNYPNTYQTLCHNCNWAKSHGGCPHAK